MKRTLTLATLLALGAAAYVPLPSMAQTSYSVVIGTAPPPLRYEAVPAPRRGYIWAPGHWEWRGHRHEWVSGGWIAERPGYVYNSPNWYRRDGGWVYEPARWSAYAGGYGGGYGGGDRDRWERERWERERWERQHERERWDRHEARRWDEDRDGIPNRYDRDRDGDGVPNRYDRAPDNRRWR
jgi:hypothetical protein